MTVATFYKAYFLRWVPGGLWKVFMLIKKIFKMWWYKQIVILNITVGNREINKKCFLSYKKVKQMVIFEFMKMWLNNAEISLAQWMLTLSSVWQT